jgi:hypothetical protein
MRDVLVSPLELLALMAWSMAWGAVAWSIIHSTRRHR